MPSAGGAKGRCPLETRPSSGSARGLCPLNPCDFFVKKSSKNFITPAGGMKTQVRRCALMARSACPQF
ncbi:hypothetical protein D7X33_04350 [Butyricicoccus sp. 1XD8-22]|nr:hypothetical protein D7X33_04350 [Butyricicoccus sp. 1XD8-22]